jgi:hypothetical protein
LTKRKAITDRMKVDSMLFWFPPPCAECGDPIYHWQKVEWDHVHAIVFDGPHDVGNIRPLHAMCHTEKTIRDVKALAKVKRLQKARGICPVCNGNDGDAPCAYPTEMPANCLRLARIAKTKKKIPSRKFPKRAA